MSVHNMLASVHPQMQKVDIWDAENVEISVKEKKGSNTWEYIGTGFVEKTPRRK